MGGSNVYTVFFAYTTAPLLTSMLCSDLVMKGLPQKFGRTEPIEPSSMVTHRSLAWASLRLTCNTLQWGDSSAIAKWPSSCFLAQCFGLVVCSSQSEVSVTVQRHVEHTCY